MMHEIKYTPQGMEYRTPFDRSLVDSLKSKIPQNERAWSPENKCWIVHKKHKTVLDDLSMIHFNEYPNVVGSPLQTNTGPIIKLLSVKYIGVPKDRGSGEATSLACDMSVGFGVNYKNENWNMVFSEEVLKDWFECGIGGGVSANHDTLYSLLMVARTAAGLEIKKAHRKMARRYHPDVNKDDDAGEMFKKIQNAYEVLSNPLKRRKYDAGLALEASLSEQPRDNWQDEMKGYRPPLRCGLIMAQGKDEIGRFVVEKIIQWEPITKNGLELVTSFDRDLECIVESWI